MVDTMNWYRVAVLTDDLPVTYLIKSRSMLGAERRALELFKESIFARTMNIIGLETKQEF